MQPARLPLQGKGLDLRLIGSLQSDAVHLKTVLAEYEGCSLDEIASSVEADVGTVKSRLHRARENLRRMLAPLKESRSSHGAAK